MDCSLLQITSLKGAVGGDGNELITENAYYLQSQQDASALDAFTHALVMLIATYTNVGTLYKKKQECNGRAMLLLSVATSSERQQVRRVEDVTNSLNVLVETLLRTVKAIDNGEWFFERAKHFKWQFS